MIKFIKYCASLIFIISIIFSHSKCNIDRQDPPKPQKLLLKNSYKISVPEPSDLALSHDNKNLWTVSDQNNTVYLMNRAGKILKSFKVDMEDLEGITVIDSTKIAIIAERTREVMVLDTSGTEIKRVGIDLKGRLNEGIEGVCFDPNENNFYFVNEKRPGLFIVTDNEFKIKSKTELEFAKDYSALSFDKFDNSIWVLSDESRKFFKIDRKGKVLQEFQIFINQPEGIAVDQKNKKVFIISDKTEKLYEYDLP